MPDITELQQDRNAALRRAQKVVEEAREERGDGPADDSVSLTAEERDTFDDWMDEVSDYNDRISDARADQDRLDRLEQEREKLDERAREPVARGAFDGEDGSDGEDEERVEWFSAASRYLMHGLENLESREVEALRTRGYETRESNVVVGTSGQGGVLVPTEFEDTLFQELKSFGGLQQAVEAARGDPIEFPIDTANGRPLDVPIMDDTANQAGLVNEGSTIGSVSNLSLVTVNFHDNTYQSGPIAVSFEMLQDSAIDPESVVRMAITNRIGRRWAKDLIDSTATSSTAPQGLIGASTGATSIVNGSSNLGFADLYDLKHSVDNDHRERDARWLFTDQTLKVISKITDSNGQFLLQPDQQQSAEGLTLLGHPWHIDNSSTEIEFDAVASGTTAKKVIWFGNFGRFGIRRIRQTEVLTLREKFALQRKTGFVGFVRVDSRLMQSTGLSADQRPIRALVENT